MAMKAARLLKIPSNAFLETYVCRLHSSPVCTAISNKSLFGLGRLNHVAIACPDLKAASAFYKDTLGATISDTVVGSCSFFGNKLYVLQPMPEHGVYTVFVQLNNTKIELLHPLGAKSPIQAFLDKNKSGGMHHICLEVDDINKAIAEVRAKGIRTLGDKPKIGAHNKPVMFLHPKDCNGVLIELEQV